MTRVIIAGALGKMGRVMAEEISLEDGLELAGAVEAAGHPGVGSITCGVEVTADIKAALIDGDIMVDFTNPAAAVSNILECAKAGKAAVVGTTGLSPEQLEEARKAASDIPLLISPNMSVGVNLMFRLVEDVSRSLPDFDAEVVEIHHNRKKDSPSGTAARIADILKTVRPDSLVKHGREGMAGPRKQSEIGMHSLRGGDVTGEHTVIFAGNGERLELTHRAHSRRTFARGAIRAIRFMTGKKPGLYTMADVLALE